MIGHYFIEKLIEQSSQHRVTVIGGEPHLAYDRVHLSQIFAGSKPEDLALTTREHYKKLNVEGYFGDPVKSIDRENKFVRTNAGKTFSYDKLVLATGSYAFIPPIAGADLPGCLAYRTIDDLGAIRAESQSASSAAVLGGGLLGLEAANALKNLGLRTHVVEFAPGLMSQQLDQRGSQLLKAMIEELDVQVHTNKSTQQIVVGDKSRLKMLFSDDTQLDVDMVVFSAGIRPYDNLAKDAGLETGSRGGIVIDHHCRSSNPDIYAIGECALFEDRIFGLVAPGYRMAETAVSQLGDGRILFAGGDMSTKLKLLGIDVGAVGELKEAADGAVSYEHTDEKSRSYKRIIVSKDGKQLLGAVLVGDCSDYDSLLQYYLGGIELPVDPETLLIPPPVSDTPVLSAGSLPATTVICFCHNVTKSTILDAIAAGALSLEAVREATAANTGCGGCIDQLKLVIDSEVLGTLTI
ncbi:MAG: FAD-dependent oxidoreductase [Pseudohongiella sp.]|nr:FAD-dependent oxidoreductase [Pseudohongiella sp.]